MANYFKAEALAEAVLFDGTTAAAEAAVIAFPAYSSVQKEATPYIALTAEPTLDADGTGVTIFWTVNRAISEQVPTVIQATITHGGRLGQITIGIDGIEEQISLEETDE